MARDPWAEIAVEVTPRQGGGGSPVATLPREPDEPKTTFRTLTPDEVTNRGLNPQRMWQISSQGAVTDLGALPEQALSPEDQDAVRSEARQKLALIDSLEQRSRDGWFATGFGSDTMASIPGTGAADVAKDVNTLASSGALQRIMEMSATNGGKNPLTPLSNADFVALGQSIANLDPTQSDAQFKRNLQAYRDIYRRAYIGAGGDPAELDRPDEKDKKAPPLPAATTQNSPIPGVREPTREQIYSGGVQWGDQASEMQDSVSDYLEKNFGVGPGTEAEINAFWNAQLGNSDLTVDGVKEWYSRRGISVPGDADIAAAIEMAQTPGVTFTGSGAEGVIADYYEKLDKVLKARGADPEGTAGTIGAKAAQGLMWGSLDEIAGLAGAAKAAFQEGNPIAGYKAERDLIRREQDRAAEANPGLAIASELGGGFVTGGAGFRNVRTVADAARAGAITGGITGFNYGEGPADSLGGAVIGAGIGAAAGAGGQRLSNAATARAAARAQRPPSLGRQVISAADRLNDQFGTAIRPIPADVAGPGVRNATGASGKMPFGAALIGRTRDRLSDEAEKARDAIGRLAGSSQQPETAGESALKGAQAYITRSRAKVNTLYERARRMGGDEPVDLANARATLDQHIAELEQTPGGAKGLTEMRELRADLDKPFPVEGVKRMRTQMRDRFLGDGLRGSDLERRMGQVIEAADRDIVDNLVRAGKGDAASAYSEAAQAHRERIEVIDQVLAPFIGSRADAPKSGEQVMRAIDAATKSNSARLGRFMASLPTEDAATVRATLIDRLGKPSPGQQTDETTFSLANFLTQWNGMTDRAKGALFGGDLRAALDDLAKVASGRKEAGKSVNFSNTGSPVGWAASGSALTAAASLTPWAATLLALDGVSGAVLASPKMARWLARMPRASGARRNHIQALTKIAGADPVIAAEALGLQRQLLERFTVEPSRLAAETDAAQPPSEGRNGETTRTGSAPR